jgi:hypothetical protein
MVCLFFIELQKFHYLRADGPGTINYKFIMGKKFAKIQRGNHLTKNMRPLLITNQKIFSIKC